MTHPESLPVNRPLRIFWTAGTMPHEWARDHIQALQRLGHEVALLCPAGALFETEARRRNIPVIPYAAPVRLRHLHDIWKAIRDMRRIFRARRPDVVYYSMLPSSLWTRWAAWRERVPVRFNKPPSLWDLQRPWYRTAEHATAWMDSRVLASSQPLMNMYAQFPGARPVLSYYGLPLPPFQNAPDGGALRRAMGFAPDDFVIGMIAYMIPPMRHLHPRVGVKGHEVLLDAAQRVVKAIPRARLMIVGDEHPTPARGPYAVALRKRAKDLGVDDRVRFTGHLSNIPEVIAATDVIVVPSLSENAGGPAPALLLEKPVIASRVGGLPDLVIDGETGMLVPPADAPALADALIRMAHLPPEERRRMGARGRRHVTPLFDIDRIVKCETHIAYDILNAHRKI